VARFGGLNGPVSPWLLLVFVLVMASYLVSDAPYGQRIIPFGTALLGAGLMAAGAARAAEGDEASFATPLMLALLIAALASVVVGAVQVFFPGLADGLLVALPTTPGRAIGNMRQPNQLSTLLLWGCAAAVWLGVRQRWATWQLGACLAILVLAVLLTASRTGMVGVALLVLWGLLDRRLPRPVRGLLVGTVLLYVAGWFLLEQWSQLTGQSFYGDDQLNKTLHGDASSSRGKIWANTLAMIRAEPWRGVGTGAYNFVWSMTPFADRPVAFFDHSHNLELQLAAESGIPFAVIVVLGLLLALWQGRGAVLSRDDGRALGARTALFMGVLVGVHSQLEYPLWYTYFFLPTAMILGWYAGLATAERAQRRDEGKPAEKAVADASARQADPAAARTALTHALAAWVLGGAALLGSAWALVEYWSVAVIFEPKLAWGDPGALERRIAIGKRSVLFGHHADYAEVTMADEPDKLLPAFTRPLYHLLDTRLMMAYGKALAASNHLPEAVHVAGRLREFNNAASQEFFDECLKGAEVMPFQCALDPRLSVAEIRALQGR
jgi:O-antigen ligase